MGTRHRAREIAFLALFQAEQSGDRIESVLRRFTDFSEARPEVKDFAGSLARGAASKQAEIDASLLARTRNWSLERLGAVDRALLRMGGYELLMTQTPAEVVMDEIIQLAKVYGEDGSGKFINGVLDSLRKAPAKHLKIPSRKIPAKPAVVIAPPAAPKAVAPVRPSAPRPPSRWKAGPRSAGPRSAGPRSAGPRPKGKGKPSFKPAFKPRKRT